MPTPTGSGSASTPAVIDPDTGQVVPGTGTGEVGTAPGDGTPQIVSAVPVSVAATSGDGLQTALMLLAAGLLLGITVLPPLLARAARRRGTP